MSLSQQTDEPFSNGKTQLLHEQGTLEFRSEEKVDIPPTAMEKIEQISAEVSSLPIDVTVVMEGADPDQLSTTSTESSLTNENNHNAAAHVEEDFQRTNLKTLDPSNLHIEENVIADGEPNDEGIYPPDLEYGLLQVEEIPLKCDSKIVWETHHVVLERKPGLGFGIAVSGGVNNPRFRSGETTIAISDVLRGGPAFGKVKINDRILSINGTLMDDATHDEAIMLLRECGNVADLLIKRRKFVPSPHMRQEKTEILTRSGKDKDFGIVVGCKFYIKHVDTSCSAVQDTDVKAGDFILKINNQDTERMTLTQIQRVIHSSRSKLKISLERPPKPINCNSTGLSSNGLSNFDRVKQWAQTHGFPTIQEDPTTPDFPTDDHVRITSYANLSDAKLNERFEETMMVSFMKAEDGSTGLKFCGGNDSGIFIAAIQGGGPAQMAGVREGDYVIRINGLPVKGLNREEVVNRLRSLPKKVELLITSEKQDEYKELLESSPNQSGDLFYIKTNINHKPLTGQKHYLQLKPGNVYKITDTLPNSVSGLWEAHRVNKTDEVLESGFIPSYTKAESMFGKQLAKSKSSKKNSSLGRNQWHKVFVASSEEEVINEVHVYEKVFLEEVDFLRPVVFYGPLSDTCRLKLLKTHSNLYESPELTKISDGKHGFRNILKLDSVREVIDKGKHPLLDLPPHATEKLVNSDLHPIVIYISSDTAELHDFPKESQSRKLNQVSEKIDAEFRHLIDARLIIKRSSDYLQQAIDMIDEVQSKPVWMNAHSSHRNHLTSFTDHISLHSTSSSKLRNPQRLIAQYKESISSNPAAKLHQLYRGTSATKTSSRSGDLSPTTRPRSYSNPKIMESSSHSNKRLTFQDEVTAYRDRDRRTDSLNDSATQQSFYSPQGYKRSGEGPEVAFYEPDQQEPSNYLNSAYIEDETASRHRNTSGISTSSNSSSEQTANKHLRAQTSGIWFTDGGVTMETSRL